MNKSNSSEEKELPLYKETEVRVPIHLKITYISIFHLYIYEHLRKCGTRRVSQD